MPGPEPSTENAHCFYWSWGRVSFPQAQELCGLGLTILWKGGRVGSGQRPSRGAPVQVGRPAKDLQTWWRRDAGVAREGGQILAVLRC